MITIPKDYKEVNVDGYESIKEGGHKCVIKSIEETESSTGKKMLVIFLDTSAEDFQPSFYTLAYKRDTRDDKKWGCRSYIVLEGEYATANIKRFCTSVEHSNEGFGCWDANGFLKLEELKGKKVGVVFRGEYYTKADHTEGFSIKPWRWCSYDKADEQAVPERKESTNSGVLTPMDQGFMAVPDGLEDEGLPFR